MEFFDDAAVMTSYTPVEIFPVLGRRQGKAAIAETMRAMHADFEHLTYQPIFMVTEDQAAPSSCWCGCASAPPAASFICSWRIFLRLQDGRIVELREFMDSFDAVQQVLGQELALLKAPQ